MKYKQSTQSASEMNVLALNCGSSSFKYRLISMPGGTELAAGEAQRIGFQTAEPSRIVHKRGKKEEVRVLPMRNHAEAFEKVAALLEEEDLRYDAIGHRIVHGGAEFADSALIDDVVIDRLFALQHLAPLHNPPATTLVAECKQRYPRMPQAAVFDTSFHSSIPEHARTYAIPKWLSKELGIRKYGFHGISHQYVSEEAADFLGIEPASFSAVSCHLGSGGASLCAIRGGSSIDNTMGYCPLQGLVMSTRCGDLDPTAALRLMIDAHGDGERVERTLNTASGILGLSGVSSDIRDVFSALSGRDAESQRMIDTAMIYLWRIRKYLGAYLAVLGECRAVIFTDTIGESMPIVRSSACSNMETFGIEISRERNNKVTSFPADISSDSSRVRVLVIRTNEELAIARRTYRAIACA